MTPLFGPLAALGTTYGYLQPYGLAPDNPKAGAVQPLWWRDANSFRVARQTMPNGSPISPAPPVRNIDTPIGVPSFGPPPAATLVGIQRTRADHLFGPFAKLGTNSPANLAGMPSGVPFPNP